MKSAVGPLYCLLPFIELNIWTYSHTHTGSLSFFPEETCAAHVHTHIQYTVCCALDRQMGRLVNQVGIKGVCLGVRVHQSPIHSSSAH